MDLDDEELKDTKILNKITADEMFEKLGYIIENTNSNIFIGEGIEHFVSSFVIHKKTKLITVYKTLISFQELQAINKKCKELGWLDG